MSRQSKVRPEEKKRAVRLTKREIEVLQLTAGGLLPKVAAATLGVSKRTIDFHLANIYRKLEVSNRKQAFRAATRLGIV